MKHSHFKSAPQFSQSNINVDRDGGIIKNVSIANQGPNRNKSFFNSQFIEDLVSAGNAQTQGVKSRFGHPNMCSTSLGSYVGRYRNFTVKDGNAYADLHLDPITQKTQVEGKGISMWEYIMDMAENNSDMFGNSIHINSEEFEEDVEGKKVISHKLESFIASDLVDSPAATNSLFDNSDDLGVVLTQFLDQNPEIFETIVKKPEMIEDFFERYFDYVNSKSLTNFNMNFFEKMKKKISGEKFDVDLTLAKGGTITVVTEGQEPKAGDIVKDSDGKPLEDGDHLLADGRTIVIEGGAGAIKEIKPAGEPDPKPGDEPTTSEVMQSVKDLSKKFDQFLDKFEKSNKESQDAIEFVADKFSALDKRVTDMGKTITSKKYEAPNAESTDPKQAGSDAVDFDTLDAKRKELKEKNKR